MSWFPGRGHTVTGTAISRLVGSMTPVVLFCRRAPSQPYLLCGRLQPVAIAVTGDRGDGGGHAAANQLLLPCWTTTAVGAAS